MGKSKKHNPDENIGAKNSVPDGLVKSRSCTDVICLFVFAIFLIAWLVVGVFAFKDGHPDEIFAPFDSNNQRCGIDEDVKDRPYLFYFDLTDCLPRPGNVLKCHTPQVCVRKCPSDNFYLDYFLTERDERKLPFVLSQLVCKDGFDVKKLNSLDAVRKAVEEDKQCARWYLDSKPFANRCLPRQLSAIQDAADGINIDVVVDNTGATVSDIITGVKGQHINNATGIVKDFAAVNEYGEAILKDLKNNWRWIVLLIGVSTLVSLIYIVIMRWITSIMVWFSLLGCLGLFSFCIYYSWTKYDELKKSENGLKKLSRDVQERSPVDDLLENKDTWLAFFILSILALFIILCILLFLRKRIRIAVALINEGSKAVASSWTTIIFPIFPWICQVIVFAYGFAILVFLLATGVPIHKVVEIVNNCTCASITYVNGSLCEPNLFESTCNSVNCEGGTCSFDETETKNYAIYFHLFNVFMVFWGSFFVSGFGDMVLASTFSKYYWTFNKNNLPVFMVAGSVYQVMRYHLGTIALGSFLLALCNWIRWLIRQAHNQLNKSGNPVLKAVHCCCQCFFWCLEKFLKFLSKNAYIMCAMRGRNFCVSARKAFNLILRNVLRFAVLDGVTGYIFLLNKLLITAMVGAIAFYVFANPLPDLQDINSGDTYQTKYFYVPIIIVCLIAFFIASLFFSVYDMAVDTLFLCFLVDSEKNDGTPEKPYFMSKELMKILGKKNKKLK